MRILFSIITCALLACCAIQSPQAGPVGFRLSSGFKPSQIPGLVLWLDASQIAGLNDGDAVATWSDLSGNGFDFTQSSASLKPIYKTGIQNGLAVVRFDGVDDVLKRTGFLTSSTTTTFIVCKRSAGGGTQNAVTLTSNGGTDAYVLLCSKTTLSSNWGAFYGSWVSSSYSVDGVWRCLQLKVNGFADITLKTDTNAGESGVGGAFYGMNNSTIGNDQFSQAHSGDIAEILHYDTVLNEATCSVVVSYLRNKWGTP